MEENSVGYIKSGKENEESSRDRMRATERMEMRKAQCARSQVRREGPARWEGRTEVSCYSSTEVPLRCGQGMTSLHLTLGEGENKVSTKWA